MPIARGIGLTEADRLRRGVIERVMCDFAVNPRAAAVAVGAEPDCLDDAEPALRALTEDGLVRRDGEWVVVTEKGRPFVRAVAAAFDSYLARGVARHSAAV